MVGVERLRVSIFLGNRETEIGELVLARNKVYFKYSNSFLEKGIEISPFKMKLTSEVISADRLPFDGLFGVFNDSIPDGWGRLLLDRYLSSLGIAIQEINLLDRLAYVGTSGMGALTYRPEISMTFDRDKQIELDEVAADMKNFLEGESTDVIEKLYQLGGSSGGARPKILVGYNKVSNHIIHGAEDLPEDYEHWIIKFPSSIDSPDIAHIEYAYHKMALDAGLTMSVCKLFAGKSGKDYFGTKRFDRFHDQRIHMHSASGLLHDNYRMSTMDYGHLMDCAFQLERSVESYSKVLRLAAFNVFAHNRDDHSKNFAFLMDKRGSWQISPAYDLTFSYSAHGHHSTMVAGESKNPGKKQLLELARVFDVKDPERILDEVRDSISNWNTIANDCGVSSSSRNKIAREIASIK
jgi:serine/threonine-protein kinase HipA